MEMIKKIAMATAGLALVGSSVFAQSLADAKKAIDAEQYVKAKGMLKNLTVTQPTNAEAFFQLGWVYLEQDYVDSAKVVFTNGLAADPKSSLNYVGLGTAALMSNDQAGAKDKFGQAIGFAKKKDAEPYLYIGRGYLLSAVDGKPSERMNAANLAIDALTKGKALNEKSPEIFIELGNAYRSQFNSNKAYENYSNALTLDPKSVVANTAIGVLWRYADSFDMAEKAFVTATTNDPNFGPAYREWAETENRQAGSDRKVAVEKINSAVKHYENYLNLTDKSDESLLRYADFLVRAGQWSQVREVATKLAASPNPNARVYRYLAYAAFENKDPKAAKEYMDKWMSKADPKRVIPRDYLYHGRAQIEAGQDTTKAIQSLTKAVELDSTFADVYRDIAKVYNARRNYLGAGDAYSALVKKSKSLTLGDYNNLGRYYYFAFTSQQALRAKADPTFKQDSTLLVKADSAFSYVERNVSKPLAAVAVMRARIADLREADRNNIQGLAKTLYEKVVEIAAPDPANVSADNKAYVVEAYDYLGRFYAYKEKNDAKAIEYFTKAKELDPKDTYLDYYMQQKNAASKSK